MELFLAAVLEEDVERNLIKITKERNMIPPGYNRMMTFFYRKDIERLIELAKEIEDGNIQS